MKLQVQNIKGDVTGEVEVSDDIFAAEVKTHLVWEVVRWQQAKLHRGTHTVKTRANVNGTTTKMFKQKGTGRARHGSSKAPIFVGGGVAHGPETRGYTFKVNKKARAGALRSVLSQKVGAGKLRVIDGFDLETPKTKVAAAAMTALDAKRAIVIDADNDTLNRSVRNLTGHDYLSVDGLNVYDLMKHDTVILTRAALTAVEGRLAK